MVYFFTGSLTTRRCTFIVVRSIRRQPRPPNEWNADVGLDVREPTEAEPGQDGVSMGRIETQLFPQQDGRLPVLHLGHDSIEAGDHVRLLGVTLSSDLSLDRHANIVSATSFYWLRQLRRCVLDSHWTRIQRLYTRSCIRIVTRRPLQCCIGRRPKSDD